MSTSTPHRRGAGRALLLAGEIALGAACGTSDRMTAAHAPEPSSEPDAAPAGGSPSGGDASSGSGGGDGGSFGPGGTDAGGDAGGMLAAKHLLGGFGAYSAAQMSAVGSVGLTSVMDYVSITSGLSAAHASLKTYADQAASLGLTLIDDVPQQLTARFHTDGDMTALVNDMTSHMTFLDANPDVRSEISAYWMIDDWYTDFGSAKTALQEMTALIHQHTPGVPAICGFTGNTGYASTVAGYAQFAENFSPEGCDMVGVYLYPWGSGKPPMTNLANIEAALAMDGWNVADTPLVGIPQKVGSPDGSVGAWSASSLIARLA
jgi:hypothetical protein